MAIGRGDNDPTNSPGSPGPVFTAPGDPGRPQGSTLGGPRGGETWEDYWKRAGGGPGGSPTDFLKSLVPPDPVGNLVTGDGITPGSFLPGGGTTGAGYDGTLAGSVDDALGLKRMVNNGGEITPEFLDAMRRLGRPYQFPTMPGGGGGGGGPGGTMADPFAGMAGGAGGDYQGTPIPGAEGLDFLKLGAAEQFFKDVGGRFKDPTKSEGFADATMAKYGAGTPGATNRADEAYQQFQASTPADMSLYYQNAQRRAQEQLDKTMAARGLYGSSAAADMTGEMLMNSEADRARAEAQYGLSRAGLAGTLGSGADASSRGQSENERAWQNFLSSVAGQADSASITKLLGGMSAAGAAQGAQRNRGQDMFENNLRMGNALSGTMGEGYGPAFANDKDLFSQWLSGLVGQGAERQGQATYQAAQNRADTKDFFDTFGNTSKLFQGFEKRPP